MAKKPRKTPRKNSQLKPHGMGGDLGIEPYLPQFQRTLPMRGMTRRDLLGEPVAPRAYDEQSEENKPFKEKRHEEIAPARVAPSDQLLTDVTLQLLPGKNNPSVVVSRAGSKPMRQLLPQAEYDILLRLARAMHASARSRNSSIENWGWIDRDNLIAIIAGKSKSPGNAAYYFGTLILRLRRRLVSLIREVGGIAEPRRIIDNGAPATIKKRSVYRLSIHPNNLTLPA